VTRGADRDGIVVVERVEELTEYSSVNTEGCVTLGGGVSRCSRSGLPVLDKEVRDANV
jgi:hypothetical protein